MATSISAGIASFGSKKELKSPPDSYARLDCAIRTLLLAKKKKAARFLGVLMGGRILTTLAD